MSAYCASICAAICAASCAARSMGSPSRAAHAATGEEVADPVLLVGRLEVAAARDGEAAAADAEDVKQKKASRMTRLRRGIAMDTCAHLIVMPRRMAGKRKIRPSEESTWVVLVVRDMCFWRCDPRLGHTIASKKASKHAA